MVIAKHYPRTLPRRWMWRADRCGVCGLKWPCDEAKRERVRARYAPTDGTGAWSAQHTGAWPEVGRAGTLTPAQQYRATGGWM